MHAHLDAAEAFRVLDQECRSAWQPPALLIDRASLIDQDDDSVGDAVAAKGWPGVQSLAGCALFQLNLYGRMQNLQREAAGTCFFVRGGAADETCVYCEEQAPETITRYVSRGGMVRALVRQGITKMGDYVHPGVVLVATDHPYALGRRAVSMQGR